MPVIEHLVVLSNLAEFSLRLEVYDVVTGRLQLTEQFRHCRSGVAVEIMQQDDPLAALFQLAHYRINLLLGLVHGEIARVDMGRKDRDIPIGEIRKKLRRRWRSQMLALSLTQWSSPGAD